MLQLPLSMLMNLPAGKGGHLGGPVSEGGLLGQTDSLNAAPRADSTFSTEFSAVLAASGSLNASALPTVRKGLQGLPEATLSGDHALSPEHVASISLPGQGRGMAEEIAGSLASTEVDGLVPDGIDLESDSAESAQNLLGSSSDITTERGETLPLTGNTLPLTGDAPSSTDLGKSFLTSGVGSQEDVKAGAVNGQDSSQDSAGGIIQDKAFKRESAALQSDALADHLDATVAAGSLRGSAGDRLQQLSGSAAPDASHVVGNAPQAGRQSPALGLSSRGLADLGGAVPSGDDSGLEPTVGYERASAPSDYSSTLLAQAIRQRGAAGDGASSQSLGSQGEGDFLQGLDNSSGLDLFGGNRTAQATTAQATAETIAEALGQRIGASDAQNGGGTLRGGDQGGGFALVNSGVGARGPEPSVQSMPALPDLTAAPEQQEFADQLLGRVRLLNQNGVQEAKLNLHPAELGRLSISITTDGDGARVAFAVDNPQAKEALEQAMPRLRELFQQSGLQLTDSSVAQQDGSRQGDRFAQGEGRGSFNTGNAADPREDILDIVPSSRSGPNHDGSLDTYA